MDAQGPDVARRFTEAAGTRFTTAVDRAQGLWEVYGFDVVPNVFFVDDQGIARYVNIGGFDVRNVEDAQAIERLLGVPAGGDPSDSRGAPKFETVEEALRAAEEDAKRHPENLSKLLTLAERRVEAKRYAEARRAFEAALAQDPKSARALVGLAAIHIEQGERAKGAAALKQAWALEPDNWIIRKQIWAVEHPEQFYPAINIRWQSEQIKKQDPTRK